MDNDRKGEQGLTTLEIEFTIASTKAPRVKNLIRHFLQRKREHFIIEADHTNLESALDAGKILFTRPVGFWPDMAYCFPDMPTDAG